MGKWCCDPVGPPGMGRAHLDPDDGDPSTFPGAEEVCDGVDNDLDGDIDEGFDLDGDGWTACGGDCDDSAEGVNPEAAEICEDAEGEGVATLEIRFAPQLHLEASMERIGDAALDGIGGRAGYYDGVGALRDMLQSHLLQMLTLVRIWSPR